MTGPGAPGGPEPLPAPPVPLPAVPEAIDPAAFAALVAPAFPAPGPSGFDAARIGEGFGLDGRLARLRLGPAEGWPSTLVLKRAFGGMARAEAHLLRLLRRRTDLDLPVLHAAWEDPAGDVALLVLEDIAPARQGDMLVGADPADALALVREEARFHAAFLDPAPDDPDLAGLPVWGDNPARFAELVARRTEGALTRCPRHFDPLLEELTRRLPERAERLFGALGARPRTLVHSDLHLDNVLFRPSGRAVILDWSHARLGPPVIDLARFLVEGLDDAGRRATGGIALAAWREAFTAASGAPVPEAVFERDLRLALVHLWGTAVAWAGRTDALLDEPRVIGITDAVVSRGGAAVREFLDGDIGRFEDDLRPVPDSPSSPATA